MAGVTVLTGGTGFLGWHLRVLARACGRPDPVLVDRLTPAEPRRLAGILDGADRVVHLAGVNRGDPAAVAAGNTIPAEAVAAAIRACRTPPKTVVYANSIQAGNGSPYGDSKAQAAATLADATRWAGSEFVDHRLPNLFGEHGRPWHNSVVATFCQVLAERGIPRIHEERELDLLHATDAAGRLLDLAAPDQADPPAPQRRGVRQLARRLTHFDGIYRAGELPELTDRFDVRLFNAYRSHLTIAPIPLARHTDARGELVEAVKAHGGGGQTFYSCTVPGATRGGHFHLAKVERFVVLRGEAEIRLRRLLHDDVVTIRVSGAAPVAVDMPAMWAHDITNVGHGTLLTLFWANGVFDPDRPDTYPERVA